MPLAKPSLTGRTPRNADAPRAGVDTKLPTPKRVDRLTHQPPAKGR